MFDAHCHLYDDLLKDKIETYLKEANDLGITYFLVPSTDNKSMEEAKEFISKHKGCFLGAGYYPCDVKYLENEDVLNQYLKFVEDNRNIIKVIGEIGLDYHYDNSEREKELQKKWLVFQIDLANKYDLPICIHSRDAIQDTLNILKEHKVNKGFYLHAFTASLEMMKEFLKIGAMFSIGGVITYKNAENLRQVVKEIPLENLLVETDSPYLPPVPYRGKINEPKYIIETLRKISEIKNIDIKKLDKIVTSNAIHFFHVEN